MQKIKSFQLNHNTHTVGFYLSSQSKDIYTYDLRFKTPNNGNYLGIAAMHSIEHLFATVIRNSAKSEDVVYFGPMGCRTGFYLLLRNTPTEDALELTRSVILKCLELNAVPGNKKIECGNYKSHNLQDAKKELQAYYEVIKG